MANSGFKSIITMSLSTGKAEAFHLSAVESPAPWTVSSISSTNGAVRRNRWTFNGIQPVNAGENKATCDLSAAIVGNLMDVNLSTVASTPNGQVTIKVLFGNGDKADLVVNVVP